MLLLLCWEDKSRFAAMEEKRTRCPFCNLVVLHRLRAGQDQTRAGGLHFGVEGEEGLDDVVVWAVVFDQKLA